MDDNDHPSFDWVEAIARLSGILGFNRTQVRWKLMGWKEKWRDSMGKGKAVAQHIGYQHRVCPHCGNLQDRTQRVCTNCGKLLMPRFLEILGRFGIVTPHFQSVSSLLTLGILVCYLRTVLAQGGFNPLAVNIQTLLNFGGNYAPATFSAQWWRLATYIFLHAGLWHILFNLIALQQIGPSIEEIFGKGRMVFYFMLTGVLAGAGSAFFHPGGVSIGASGALMGLVGLAAGWGQREGTRIGHQVRDQMVTWGVYTLVFGFMIGADNAAHVAGFVSGGLMGLFSKPKWERPGSGVVDMLLGLTGSLCAVGAILLVLFQFGGG